MGMQGMPQLEGGTVQLRRHGDEVERLAGGYYVALGRTDDTMNLGGIKVCRCLDSSRGPAVPRSLTGQQSCAALHKCERRHCCTK